MRDVKITRQMGNLRPFFAIFALAIGVNSLIDSLFDFVVIFCHVALWLLHGFENRPIICV